ncbi:MAG: serine hydrolase domain-containing protein [Agriterribacter sp.]
MSELLIAGKKIVSPLPWFVRHEPRRPALMISIRNIIFLFLLFTLNLAAANAQQQEIQSIAGKLGIPAIQVVHVKDGIVSSFALGKKKFDSTAYITQNTIFQAASLTKVVTAYAFFKLYDKGLIALDKPLSDYYSYNRLSNDSLGKKITARMVLTHRTGLLNWEGNVGTDAWKNEPLHVQFEPGTKYQYSGEGFYYLQLVMESITGKSLREIIQQEVFKPLGMLHSDMQWNDSLFVDFAYGHNGPDQSRRLAKWRYNNAAYTLYTTASDYTRFVQQALLEGRGLKKQTHQLMISKANEAQKEPGRMSDDDKFVPCALGMRLQLNEKGVWLWHTGSNPGFRCFFIANIKTKETLVAFNNSETGMPVFNELMQLFLERRQTFYAYNWKNGELD